MSHRRYGGNWPEREGKPHGYGTFLGKLGRLGCVMPMTRNCLTTLIADEDPLLVHSVTTTDLDSTESKEVALDTIPMTWNLRFLKRWMGRAWCWGDYCQLCAHTRVKARWGLHSYTPASQGTVFLGTSAGLSDMTCSWEECTYNSLLNCHNNSERKWLLSPYYRWGKL